ncbi:MAG: hypothetical protein ACYCYO_20830 [Bacilli bacterium]
MIKIIDIVERTVDVEIEVVSSVRTYDITTTDMTDNCTPYRFAQKAMMWLNQNGFIAEVECIYPQTVDNPVCAMSDDVNTRKGSPILELDGESGQVWVEEHDASFTIWFEQGHEIEQEIVVARNLKVLASQSQVLGITAIIGS